jgi:TRAP-type mannitol/chloroaromatic compound transport system permease large subunit
MMLTIVIVVLLALYFLGVHVAAVLGIITLGLMSFFSDRPLWEMTGMVAWNVGTTNVLVAVPMFIFMGEVLLRGGLTDKLYRCFAAWFNWLPGGLLHANIATCAAFASIAGSTAATAATIGSGQGDEPFRSTAAGAAGWPGGIPVVPANTIRLRSGSCR